MKINIALKKVSGMVKRIIHKNIVFRLNDYHIVLQLIKMKMVN